MAREKQIADELITALEAEADPNRAVNEKRYLKSPADMRHIGVKVPIIRKYAKSYIRAHVEVSRHELLDLVAELWSRNVHESRMLAIELLNARPKLLIKEDVGPVERMIDQSHTWAYVDSLSINTMGGLLDSFPNLTRVLDRWAVHQNFWLRRAAMLSLLLPLRIGAGDFKRFARYAESMLDEKEFFIRKAIGWVLRETSKKQPELVIDWLSSNAHRSSALTAREAVKYLPSEQADSFINAAKTGAPAS